MSRGRRRDRGLPSRNLETKEAVGRRSTTGRDDATPLIYCVQRNRSRMNDRSAADTCLVSRAGEGRRKKRSDGIRNRLRVEREGGRGWERTKRGNAREIRMMKF